MRWATPEQAAFARGCRAKLRRERARQALLVKRSRGNRLTRAIRKAMHGADCRPLWRRALDARESERLLA
jgi:hypothetical protein